MPAAFLTPCGFAPTLSGTADFIVSTALSGFAKPQDCRATNGKTYRYSARSADGLEVENGAGAWNAAQSKLSRTTVFSNSLGTTDLIDFSVVPEVYVFPSSASGLEERPLTDLIEVGTIMTFQQSAAPLGWTKLTTHNDKALRVVSGSASSGGLSPFSTIFASRTVDGHSLSLSELTNHNHSELYPNVQGGVPGGGVQLALGSDYTLYVSGTTTGSTGGGAAHDHTIEMRVQYVDLILAQRTLQ